MRKLVVLGLIFVCLFAFAPVLPIRAGDVAPVIPTVDTARLSDIPPSPPQGEGFYSPKLTQYIVIHHSGSFPADNSSEANSYAVAGYANYHKFTVHPGIYGDQNTWAWRQAPDYTWYQTPAQEQHPDGRSEPAGYNLNAIDYSWLVGTDAKIYQGRDEKTIGWHSSNWAINLSSIGICFVGNFSVHGPDQPQYLAGVDLLSKKMEQFQILPANIYKHSDFTSTDCPGYAFPFDQMVLDASHWVGVYADVGWDYWARPNFAALGKLGLLTGYDTGELKPEKPITRAELVVLLWRAAGMPATAWVPVFIDTLGHWASGAINWAKVNDIVSGYADQAFRPDQYVTRAEIATIIARWLKLGPVLPAGFWDVPSSFWAAGSIGAMRQAGIMTGYLDGYFRPNGNSTRAEAFVSVERALP